MRTFLVWFLAVCAWPVAAAQNCEGAQNIRLVKAVQLDPSLAAELRTLPPLRALAVDAKPLAHYNQELGVYEGIGVDILCFVLPRLGVEFEIFAPNPAETLADKLNAIAQGTADLFLPVSYVPERAKLGIYSAEFARSHYAAVGRRDAQIVLRTVEDLAQYRVGYVPGASIERALRTRLPGNKLVPISDWQNGAIFRAVQQGEVDLVVYNQHVFNELRFMNRLLDLEIKYTLYEYPRMYSFYFSRSPAHEKLVSALDQYLAALDISASVVAHQDGERTFLERYEAQRQQKTLLLIISVVAGVLILTTSLLLWRHRRQLRRLKRRSKEFEHEKRVLKEEKQRFEDLSRTDPLTNVPNRRHFDDRAKIKYARHIISSSCLSLLIIDIDHFKRVNDSYGHATGDEYLRTIATILKSALRRQEDVVARYGGEEFICLLSNTGPEEALEIAERMRKAVETTRLPNIKATPPWVTVSIGVATLRKGDPGLHGLFERADEQLYLAKEKGRNQVRSIVMEV